MVYMEERIGKDGEERHLIMSIDVQPVDFDLTGNLTSAGKITFWKEVNRAIQKLDENKISLKPRGNNAAAPVNNINNQPHRMRTTFTSHQEHSNYQLRHPYRAAAIDSPQSDRSRSRSRSQYRRRREDYHEQENRRKSRTRSRSRRRSRSRSRRRYYHKRSKRSSHPRKHHHHHYY